MKIVNKIKEQVAKETGYGKMFGTYWKTAMIYTHRKKIQLELYEEVINRLGIIIGNSQLTPNK